MVIAAIVAGGSGARMGTTVPKQFLKLGDRSVLIRTVDVFVNHPQVDAVIIGVPKEWIRYTEQLLEARYGKRRRLRVTEGGASRNETLWKICQTAERYHPDDDSVLVTHDAVRPFVTTEMITACIEALNGESMETAATAAIPATDTILHVTEKGLVKDVPSRSSMMQAQTPQTMRLGAWKKLYPAMKASERELRTDVSGIFRAAGYRVKVVPGARTNIKITTPEDLEFAKILAAKADREEGEKNNV